MNADGSEKTYLYGNQGEKAVGTHIASVKQEFGFATVVKPTTDEPDQALIAIGNWNRGGEVQAGVTFWKLNVRNGYKRRADFISTSPNAPLLSGLVVVADGRGDLRYALVADDDRGWVEKRRATSGNWETVQKHGPDDNVELVSASNDGRNAYLRVEDDRGRTCTVEREIGTGAQKTLVCDDTPQSGEALGDVDGTPVIIKRWAGGTRSAEVIGTGPEAHAYRLLIGAFPAQTVTITSRTRDGRRFIARVDSDRNPGDYYLFDLDRKAADYLFAVREWIEPDQMAPQSPIQFKARDGLLLRGFLTSRNGLVPERRPLIILPHGGPHGVHDRWQWDGWVQYLASLGYSVLQVNYRGSGGYGRAFETAGYREWGGKMQDDLADGVRWAIDQGIGDPTRVCIMGASWGGYAAVMSAVREPALYRCAVDFAGPVDLITMSRDSDIAENGFGRQYLATVLGKTDEELRKNSPITYIERLNAPVLIAHGSMDERVPFNQAKALKAALDRLRKPYVWLPLEGEEHGFYLEGNEEKFLLAVKSFLAENIGPGIASPPPAK